MTTRAELLLTIGRAWRASEHPGNERLAGRESCGDEYAYVAEHFRGKRWTDVGLRWLVEEYPRPHDACLSFMSGEAFRYYLPAYMKIAVEDRDTNDSATDSAVFALTPPRFDPAVARIAGPGYREESMRSLRAWWDERVAGFTPDQVAAIRAFLEHMVHEHADRAAETALERWQE